MHAAGMAPARIALFGYAHVPWMRPHQRLIDEATLPAGDDRLDLARIARETIDAFGYEAIGIDHFARPEDGLVRPATSAGCAATSRATRRIPPTC